MALLIDGVNDKNGTTTGTFFIHDRWDGEQLLFLLPAFIVTHSLTSQSLIWWTMVDASSFIKAILTAYIKIPSASINVTGLALPYGTYNETVRKVALEAGYQALFTLDGRHMGIDAPADNLGCYAIESNKPKIFKAAMDFRLSNDFGQTRAPCSDSFGPNNV